MIFEGLAGMFRVDSGLNQYGAFFRWRITSVGKKQYVGEASPFFFNSIPESEPVRCHLFGYSTSDHSSSAPIGCVVALAEIGDLDIFNVNTLYETSLQFELVKILEYTPDAVSDEHLNFGSLLDHLK